MSSVEKVLVLMATYNGAKWLNTQLDSILEQSGVGVELLISDDASTDGTIEIIEERMHHDPRINLLPNTSRAGSAAGNFYRIIRSVDTTRYSLIALADQDDIWNSDKLQRHIALLHAHSVDAISSDVMAFWPDGRTKYVRKSQAQRQWDFLLEPPGPGCSFLLRSEVVAAIQRGLDDLDAAALQPLPAHDWMIYLIARCSGFSWYISDVPSLMYRQHDANEVGVNAGLGAALRRLRQLGSGAYRDRVERAAAIALVIMARNGRQLPCIELNWLDLARNGRRDKVEALITALFLFRGIRVRARLGDTRR